jgi:hypothetical protein
MNPERAPSADEQRRHTRRYIVFAIALALVVLAFSAVSIAVVVSTSGS